MADKSAQEAMKDLEGKQVDGRTISVTQAKPKSDNRNGSFSKDRGNRW